MKKTARAISLILIALSIVWCADVSAHGEDECLKGQNGSARLSNGGWVKVTGHLSGIDLDDDRGHRYAHGHQKQYYNKSGQGTTRTKSYFDIDFDGVDTDYFTDCPTAPVQRRSRSSTPTRRRSQSSTSQTATAESVEETLDEVVRSPRSYRKPKPEPPREYRTLPPEPEPEPEPVILERHEYRLFQGYTIIGFPVRVFDDEHDEYQSEVEDFYHESNVFDSPTEGIFEHIKAEGISREWYWYQGQGLLGNRPTAGNHGVVIRLDDAETVELEGIANQGNPRHLITPGINVIGFPHVPALYKRPSDFLADGFFSVIITNQDGFSLVARKGDPGDEFLYPGQGLILQSMEELTLDLSGSVPSAPMVQRRYRTLATSWGAMKR